MTDLPACRIDRSFGSIDMTTLLPCMYMTYSYYIREEENRKRRKSSSPSSPTNTHLFHFIPITYSRRISGSRTFLRGCVRTARREGGPEHSAIRSDDAITAGVRGVSPRFQQVWYGFHRARKRTFASCKHSSAPELILTSEKWFPLPVWTWAPTVHHHLCACAPSSCTHIYRPGW